MKSKKIMKILFLILIVFTSFSSNAQRDTGRQCKITKDIEVIIDSFFTKRDSSLSGEFIIYPICNPCYLLKTQDREYKIVSFVLQIEQSDTGVFEIDIEGDTLVHNGVLIQALRQRKMDMNPVYFYCIKAKDKTGNVFILKPFSSHQIK